MRSCFQNSCFVSHWGIQTSRNDRSTRPTASCFHLLLVVWIPRWNTRSRFRNSTSCPSLPQYSHTPTTIKNYGVTVFFSNGNSLFPLSLIAFIHKKKRFRRVQDMNPWPLRYRCSALPTKLTSQMGADYYVGWKKTFQAVNNDSQYMKIIYLITLLHSPTDLAFNCYHH